MKAVMGMHKQAKISAVSVLFSIFRVISVFFSRICFEISTFDRSGLCCLKETPHWDGPKAVI
jgi:hypothetical protein